MQPEHVETNKRLRDSIIDYYLLVSQLRHARVRELLMVRQVREKWIWEEHENPVAQGRMNWFIEKQVWLQSKEDEFALELPDFTTSNLEAERYLVATMLEDEIGQCRRREQFWESVTFWDRCGYQPAVSLLCDRKYKQLTDALDGIPDDMKALREKFQRRSPEYRAECLNFCGFESVIQDAKDVINEMNHYINERNPKYPYNANEHLPRYPMHMFRGPGEPTPPPDRYILLPQPLVFRFEDGSGRPDIIMQKFRSPARTKFPGVPSKKKRKLN